MNAQAETLNSEMLSALGAMLCPCCGHELRHHAHKGGCEIERGDCQGDESGPAFAMGPCGCNPERLAQDGWHDFAVALKVILKVRGVQ